MATIVNTPVPAAQENNGMGFLLGVILLIVVAVLFLLYGIPYLRNSFAGPTVNVPGRINVNVQTPQGSQPNK